ncbi:hypothetical protein EDD85DRAFT_805926 [Armillaria nabsnona]|nr:hypothetical protein EDD85DRAFT_805926 [Armillaria nabsnona]
MAPLLISTFLYNFLTDACVTFVLETIARQPSPAEAQMWLDWKGAHKPCETCLKAGILCQVQMADIPCVSYTCQISKNVCSRIEDERFECVSRALSIDRCLVPDLVAACRALGDGESVVYQPEIDTRDISNHMDPISCSNRSSSKSAWSPEASAPEHTKNSHRQRTGQLQGFLSDLVERTPVLEQNYDDIAGSGGATRQLRTRCSIPHVPYLGTTSQEGSSTSVAAP